MTKNTDMTVADLATELGTDPRTARKVLRKVTPKDDQPGKGGRWSIPRKSLPAQRKALAAHTAPEVVDATDAE